MGVRTHDARLERHIPHHFRLLLLTQGRRRVGLIGLLS